MDVQMYMYMYSTCTCTCTVHAHVHVQYMHMYMYMYMCVIHCTQSDCLPSEPLKHILYINNQLALRRKIPTTVMSRCPHCWGLRWSTG